MSESSEVVSRGTSAAPEVSAVAAPIEEGGGETSLEDAPRGPEGSALR